MACPDPYTNLTFFRGDDVSAGRITLLHGADPEQVAAGTQLAVGTRRLRGRLKVVP
ncbi:MULTISPECIES: hypothetical protein [unclassified Streptomyces]|uniref:hypothetical protein n=1 Tax=unclassified Streptomyces TaxID=2593676 RepID=UPI0016513DFD|nr:MULTISPECIES: hypothetical protein [unclassified Streptomyces]